jgi:hypothetical protein
LTNPVSVPEPSAQTLTPQAIEQPADISKSHAVPSATVEADKPTSGVLCDGPIELSQYGELSFRNLPGGQLKFIYDHDAWQPTIYRELDGTQTLMMHSIKPGIQTKCDMRWEKIVQ